MNLTPETRRLGYSVLNLGAVFKMLLMNFRASFITSSYTQYDKAGELSSFFDMELVPWVSKIVDSYLPSSILTQISVNTYQRDMIFHKIMEVVTPCASVQKRVGFMAYQNLGDDTSSVHDVARQMDRYYATLVHGAAVRVPLPEIWCPENEMEHTARDSKQFFDVMWKSLKEVLQSGLGNNSSPDVSDVTNAFMQVCVLGTCLM